MTLQASNNHPQSGTKAEIETIPAFKPVALPALAAAMRSTKHPPRDVKTPVLPAILRKEAMLAR